MQKPVLVGMLNPRTLDPKLALAPGGKENSTGKRLLSLLRERVPAVSRSEYMSRFERVNLCYGTWDETEAKRAAVKLRASWRGRYVVLLGHPVRKAFGFAPLLLRPIEFDGNTWFQIPHPSGKCRWYNDEGNRARAADLLTQLYRTDRETFDG